MKRMIISSTQSNLRTLDTELIEQAAHEAWEACGRENDYHHPTTINFVKFDTTKQYGRNTVVVDLTAHYDDGDSHEIGRVRFKISRNGHITMEGSGFGSTRNLVDELIEKLRPIVESVEEIK